VGGCAGVAGILMCLIVITHLAVPRVRRFLCLAVPVGAWLAVCACFILVLMTLSAPASPSGAPSGGEGDVPHAARQNAANRGLSPAKPQRSIARAEW
jgi:hypothetical protein